MRRLLSLRGAARRRCSRATGYRVETRVGILGSRPSRPESPSMPTRTPSSKILIALLVLVAAAAAGAVVWRPITPSDAADGLPAAPAICRPPTGRRGTSQFAEEWIIRDFFQDKRDGVFVDVGANHYRDQQDLLPREPWVVRAGDRAAREFEADYKAHRPRTTFPPFFVADVSERTAKLYVLDAHTVVAPRIESSRSDRRPASALVPTITLNDLLRRTASRRSTSCRWTSSCPNRRR